MAAVICIILEVCLVSVTAGVDSVVNHISWVYQAGYRADWFALGKIVGVSCNI